MQKLKITLPFHINLGSSEFLGTLDLGDFLKWLNEDEFMGNIYEYAFNSDRNQIFHPIFQGSVFMKVTGEKVE